MASTSLSLTILFLIIALSCITIASTDDDEYEYSDAVTDDFQSLNPRSGSRFLREKIKKGDHCDEEKEDICPSVPARNGTQLLSCCKNHCRNVLSDRNNCGQCGAKCGFGQLCCNGICTVVAYDVNNCGKCGNVCPSGVRCEYGLCGYA